MAVYEFVRRMDLPTIYGDIIRVDEPGEGAADTPVGEDGLPILVPITDPEMFSEAEAMNVFVSTKVGPARIHFVSPTDMALGPCEEPDF